MKHPQIFTIAFLFCLFGFTASFSQNILLQEDFNDCELPSDWTMSVIGDGESTVFVTDAPETFNSNSDGSTIDGTCMLIIDDDGIGPDEPPATTQFTTPSFDGTQNSSIKMSVDVHFRYIEESAFRIYVFDGLDYVQLVNYQYWEGSTGEQFGEFVTFTADLCFYAHPEMHLMFEYDDGETWGWWAGIDNLVVEGTENRTNLIVENFDDCNLPQGWVTNILTGESDWQIGYVENNNTSVTSMNGSCFAYFDDDGLGNDAPFSSALLISPEFDGTEFADFRLDFDVILRRYEELENLSVGVWDGTNFNIAVSYFSDLGGPIFDEYVHESIDLSAFRAPTMRVAFLYDDGDGWGWWVGLDNIKISGEGAMNDLCENAFELFLDEDCLPGDNTNALYLGDQPACANENVGALWYRYQSESNGIIKVITNANFNDVVTVYEGNCSYLLNELCDNWDEYGFVGESFYFNAEAGMQYMIRVSGQDGDFGIPRGEVCMQLQAAPAFPNTPTNDLCENAQTLVIDGDCENGNNNNANFDGPEPSLNLKSRADIWYKFEVTTNNKIEIISNADFSDVIALYEGECGDFSEIAVNDYGQKLEVSDLVIGETYYVQISGFFATLEGNVCVEIKEVTIDPPSNDDCVAAMTLEVDGSCTTVSNLGAGFDGPKPSCEVFPAANVWFELVAPTSGSVQINTGANFVHVLSIYHGDCNDLEEFYCFNNPTPCNGYVTVGGLIADETYLLQVATATDIFENGNGGELCISLIDGNAMPAEPLDMDVVVECLGAGVGQLNVTVTGGMGSYTIEGNQNGDILNTDTDYLIVVSDDSGCEISMSGTMNCGELDCALSAVINETNITCFAANNGIAEVELLGSVGEVSYLWSNDEITPLITNLLPGGYTLTITDESGCTITAATTIEEPALLIADANSTDETAHNTNNGTVSAEPYGGTTPYNYEWSNGSTSQSQNGLEPGIYTVTVTDANFCQSEQTVEISAFECALEAAISSENITCNGANDGQANISINGGNEPYYYEWSNGETTQNIENLSPGNYTVTATDDTGCPIIESVTITQPDLLIANATATGETGNNANDGTASISPEGGTAPLIYLWSNDETTQTIENLSPGNYSVTVTDANGCENIQTVSVTSFDCGGFSAALNFVTDVTCFGGSDGIFDVSAMGGTPPYNYNIAGPVPQGSAGIYTIFVSDASNCEIILNATISEPPPLVANFTNITHADCIGNATGSASVQVSGGVGGASINWSNGGTGSFQNNLEAGNYFVTVTDFNFCQTIAEVDILVEDNINPIVSTQNISIQLDADGAASISVDDINNGSSDNCEIASLELNITNFNCDNLGENEVILKITDINGNINEGTAIVTIEDEIAPILICPANVVSGNCNGFVEYDLPIGTYNCSLEDPTLLAGLPSGSEFPSGETLVTYLVADLSGNTATCSFTVFISNPLTAEITATQTSCVGSADGTATVTVMNGAGDLTYTWSNGQSTQTAEELGAGIYTVTVTDENDCSIIEQITVPEPEEFVFADLTGEQPSCNGGSDGWATVFFTGGTGEYSYLWDDPQMQTTQTATDLMAGIHTITVTDENGCEGVFMFQMGEPEAIAITVVEVVHDYFGVGEGAITIFVEGGIDPYDFEWYLDGDLVSGQQNPTGLYPGEYTVEVIDANGCVVVSEIIEVEVESNTKELQETGHLAIYPNPTSGKIFVDLELNQFYPVQIVIYDVAGKLIQQLPETTVFEETFVLDLSELANGVYNVKVKVAEELVIRKVVLVD